MNTALLINFSASFLAFVTYVTLLVYVLRKGPTRLLNWFCALLLATFAVWSLGDTVVAVSLTHDGAMQWLRIASLGWTTFPAPALWFCLAFTGRHRLVTHRLFLALSSLPAIASAYLQWTGHLIVDCTRESYGWAMVWSASSLPLAFAAYYLVFIGAGLSLVYVLAHSASLTRIRKQAWLIFISAAVSLVLGSLTDVVLPLLGIASVPPVANAVLLIWAFALAYGISRYGLMTVTPSLAADSILETMGDSLVLADTDGSIITANRACQELLGYTEPELAGMGLEALAAPDPDADATWPETAFAGQSLRSRAAALVDKAGDHIPVVLGSTWIDEDGEPLGVVVTAHDMRDHVAAERALRDSEERYRTLVENALVGIGIHQELRMVFANREFHRMLGYAPGEIIGMPIADLIHPDRRQAIVTRAQRRQSGHDEPTTYEIALLTKAGTTLWAMISNAVVEHAGQVATLITVADISDSRARRELEEANMELESFSSSVSHDLRSPLRSIDGFSQALLEDYEDSLDETGRDYLRRIRAAGERMDRLLADLQRLSRLSGSEMRDELVDLSQIVHELADELQAREPDRQVEFVIAGDVAVEGDRFLLRAAMDNLVRNAWKFTSKHARATIEFGVTRQEGEPVYFVRDDGAGFDMRYAHKLFSPFQRLHGADEFEGTGIGLATVQRIVHRHGGRIWAEGEVEHGATFFFTLAP